jgi:hypothetical protein
MLADVVDQFLLRDQPPNVLLHGVAEQALFIMMLATVEAIAFGCSYSYIT